MHIILNCKGASRFSFRPVNAYGYMNDIHSTSSKFHANLFAYDINLISTVCSFDGNIYNTCNLLQLSNHTNKEFKNIHIWLEIYKLLLNVKKTKVIIFHHNNKTLKTKFPQLKLSTQLTNELLYSLSYCRSAFYLGRTCAKISNKISISFGIMYKLNHLSPQKVLGILCSSTILPHLEYCILSWGNESDRLLSYKKNSSNYYMQ